MTSKLPGGRPPAESGYSNGFLFVAGVTLLAVIAALFIPATDRVSDGDVHVSHAERAIVPGATLTEG